jgi:hypothetical protein
VFNSSGSGHQGSVGVALSYWTLILDDHGNIIDETTPIRVDLGGTVTSLEGTVGEQLGYGDVLYPYATGDFIVGAPEPAAWSLMLCAIPLVFVNMRRKKIRA